MTVYVYYPRGSRTGGPEALHQLAQELNAIGIDACLVPIPGTESQLEVPEYGAYDCRYAASATDSECDTVVVPEVAIHLLGNFHRAKRVLWWLSIDNSSLYRHVLARQRGIGTIASFRQQARSILGVLSGQRPSRRHMTRLVRSAVNCTQSVYAWSYLFSHLGIVSSMLTDFTDPADFPHVHSGAYARTIVAYNPKKGAPYTAALVRRRPDVEWCPIVNMTRDQVISTLQKAAIYLDLGHHPGKDRLPREAALAGSVVIVAKRGAGAFHTDTPLNWRYKVDVTGNHEETALDAEWRLDWALANLAEAHAEQAEYVNWIRAERARFRREVEAVFKNNTLGFDVPGFARR